MSNNVTPYMRQYLLQLTALTLICVVASFLVMWLAPNLYIPAMTFLAAYFGLLTGLQHWVTIRGMSRSPRTFVQLFLGMSVAVLLLHLVLIVAFMLSVPTQGKRFLLAFCVGYIVYLVFETVKLVKFVDKTRKGKQ